MSTSEPAADSDHWLLSFVRHQPKLAFLATGLISLRQLGLVPARLLKQMNFGNFTLSNFKSTTIGDNMVVTFTMWVAETIDSKRLPAKPAYRLSVWKKGPNGWQWISHANFTPIR